MSVELERVGWEDGTLVTPARVEVDGVAYDVTDAEYSGTTPLSAQNLKKMENNTEQAINEVDSKYTPQAIYCKLSAEVVTNTSGYQNITNWEIVNAVGTSFTLQNGQIKIPAGVTKDKVTTKIRAYHQGVEGLYGFITKNSTNQSPSWVVDDVNGYMTICNQAILDVQENDLISANVYGNTIYIQASSTTIIVEKMA